MFFLFADDGTGWVETWLNYPGLEGWKFINLAVFLAVGFYLLRQPLGQALQARRERIRLQIIEAEKERDEAQAKLTEVENNLARVGDDVAAVKEQAEREAQLERQRLVVLTDKEIAKMRYQAQRQIETATKVAKQELRNFLAQRSVELAREAVRRDLKPEDDIRLIQDGIVELGRKRA